VERLRQLLCVRSIPQHLAGVEWFHLADVGLRKLMVPERRGRATKELNQRGGGDGGFTSVSSDRVPDTLARYSQLL
jgi:hypothetical protein